MSCSIVRQVISSFVPVVLAMSQLLDIYALSRFADRSEALWSSIRQSLSSYQPTSQVPNESVLDHISKAIILASVECPLQHTTRVIIPIERNQ